MARITMDISRGTLTIDARFNGAVDFAVDSVWAGSARWVGGHWSTEPTMDWPAEDYEAVEEALRGADVMTSAHVRALQDEALAAGDEDMAAVCDDALTGDAAAWDECAEAIEADRAMLDG